MKSTVRRSNILCVSADFKYWSPEEVVRLHGCDPGELKSYEAERRPAWIYYGWRRRGSHLVRMRLFHFPGQRLTESEIRRLLAVDGFRLASPQLIGPLLAKHRRTHPARLNILFLGGEWEVIRYAQQTIKDGQTSQAGPYLSREVLGLRGVGPRYGVEAVAKLAGYGDVFWFAGED